MKSGRPRKVRVKKSLSRRLRGRAKKGARNPKQVAAALGRRRLRRGK